MTRRITISVILAVALMVFGFIYLLRSCLSQFDERAAIGGSSFSSASQFLVFEKEGKGVIFSLVQLDKTVSYRRNGGVVNKSVSTTYYAQSNDLATAAKIKSQKIKHHRDVKNFPIEILGAAGNHAWLFVGELLAYDPFTLEKTADAAMIETKNPALKGKLIKERRYYDFDADTKEIFITAADGVKYSLNTSTLVAKALDEDNTGEADADKKIKEPERLKEQTREEKEDIYNRFRENNRLYNERKLTVKQYRDSTQILQRETRRYDLLLDSLEKIVNEAREEKSAEDDLKRAREQVRRNGSGYSGMKFNSDTIGGTWYGLYSSDEIQKTGDRFRYESNNDETARNKLYTSSLYLKNNYWTVDDEKKKILNAVYLQGGFLLSKETGFPVRLPDGFLIVHKDMVGREGIVQLTRIRFNGEKLWTTNTGLKEFYDWQLPGNKLVVTGTDNKNLGSGEVNVLLVFDLQNGHVAAYDFFKDKAREMK